MKSPISVFSDNFKSQPYWWENAPREQSCEHALPKHVDVCIIGSGYTGLSAAIQTARASRNTLVLEANVPGYGCSSRNGGQVSNSLKPNYRNLVKRIGVANANAILREGLDALDYIDSFINQENIDCNWSRCGRFVGAHNKKAFLKLCDLAKENNPLNLPSKIISPKQIRDEIDTDFYHGGAVVEKVGSLDPGKYHSQLMKVAINAGVNIIANCKANNIVTNKSNFTVQTEKGEVLAKKVIVATNGYSNNQSLWFKRRVIPIGSYIIATEPIKPDLINRLIPTNRMIIDTRKVVYYYRKCPDNQRILFGGRVALKEQDTILSAPLLHDQLCKIFPELINTKVSHSWMGYVAYTFDEMPHFGVHDGIHYAMGYCGSGISLSTYFGMKIGQKVLSNKLGDSPLEQVEFKSRPFYQGNPWFLAPSVLYYKFCDALPI